jgi:tetratricopeptide (TPR) repeat protein
MFTKRTAILTSLKTSTVVLIACIFAGSTPGWAQTQSEINQVSTITKREQTNASALNFIASLSLTKGDYKKAESCYKKILDIYKNDPGVGPKSAKYAMYMSKVALCQTRLDQKADAIKTSKEALSIISGQTPRNNPEEGNFIIMTRQNCTQILGKDMPPQGPPKAPAPQLKSIPLSEIANLHEREKQAVLFVSRAEKKGKSSKAYMKDVLYLANIYTLEKKYSLADPLFQKSLQIAEKKFGKNSMELQTPLSNYGYMLMQTGNTNAAQGILSRMQQISSSAEAAKEPKKTIHLK